MASGIGDISDKVDVSKKVKDSVAKALTIEQADIVSKVSWDYCGEYKGNKNKERRDFRIYVRFSSLPAQYEDFVDFLSDYGFDAEGIDFGFYFSSDSWWGNSLGGSFDERKLEQSLDSFNKDHYEKISSGRFKELSGQWFYRLKIDGVQLGACMVQPIPPLFSRPECTVHTLIYALQCWNKDLFKKSVCKPFSEYSDWPSQIAAMLNLSSDLSSCDFINSNVEGDSAEVWVRPDLEIGPGGRGCKRDDRFKFDLVKEAEDWKIKEFGFYAGSDDCWQRWSPEMQLKEISLDECDIENIKRYGHPFLRGEHCHVAYSTFPKKSSSP
jgi:hypothetical protein